MSKPMNKPMNTTMKTTLTILLGSLIWAPVYLNAAEGPDARACNLQGREIALRISEEVSDNLSADDRNRVAAIAEAVCLDFATSAASTPRSLPDQANTPVISRPSTQQQAAVAAPETPMTGEGESEDEEEDSGLFGNLRIIPAEERVQRPGLKRP